MALPVYHDVASVTIHNLQYVASQRVGCHRLDGIQTRLLESHNVMAPIFRHEEAGQIIDLSPSHLVARSGIRNHTNHTALCKPFSRQTSERRLLELTSGAVAVTL